tara:strand:+ start:7648 stop:7815 length:168 start_codon:yes stop_codon:yes gene_type:complete
MFSTDTAVARSVMEEVFLADIDRFFLGQVEVGWLPIEVIISTSSGQTVVAYVVSG